MVSPNTARAGQGRGLNKIDFVKDRFFVYIFILFISFAETY